jgi:hypothetical protein
LLLEHWVRLAKAHAYKHLQTAAWVMYQPLCVASWLNAPENHIKEWNDSLNFCSSSSCGKLYQIMLKYNDK